MHNCSDQLWSNDPNAPRISNFLYIQEKGYFLGSVIAAISYGIVVALFFQCMSALLCPVHPTTKGVRWGFLTHAVIMFSFATIGVGIDRNILSIAYIDGREFTGDTPGPIGFLNSVSLNRLAFVYVPYPMFPLSQWLADGLLLYRCFMIYSKNYWVIVLPSFMYLASIATSILWTYHNANNDDSWRVYNTAYSAICVSLNVIITLMIIIRLALHSRNIRKAIGASSGPGGLYTAVITMLVESSALNAVGYLLFIISITADSCIPWIFSSALGDLQVISQFLIILRVTNRSALTSDAISSGTVGSIHFRSGGRSTVGLTSSHGENSGRTSVGVEIQTGSQET